MSKAAHGFSPARPACIWRGGVLLYVVGGNPRRTPLIGKIAIYGWKLAKIHFFECRLSFPDYV
jgi:hypothetical protein